MYIYFGSTKFSEASEPEGLFQSDLQEDIDNDTAFYYGIEYKAESAHGEDIKIIDGLGRAIPIDTGSLREMIDALELVLALSKISHNPENSGFALSTLTKLMTQSEVGFSVISKD